VSGVGSPFFRPPETVLVVADPVGEPQRGIERAAELAADMRAELVVVGFV
jgi:hypothetical protein